MGKRLNKKEEKQVLRVLEGDSSTQRKVAKDMSREMTKQTTIVPANRGKVNMNRSGARPKVSKKDRKKVTDNQLISRKRVQPVSGLELNSRLDNYFRALQDPWTLQGIRCPVNYNPVPSFMITTAHTTVTRTYLTVAQGTSAQLTLFPGHTHNVDTDSMDGVSYHEAFTLIDAVAYPVGPMRVGAVDPIIGVLTLNVAYGVDTTNFNTVNSSALRYDVPLPYTATSNNGGHSRWKLVSMGILLENTTPVSTRGGSIQHVMPASAVTSTGNILSDFASQPTFRVTTAANEGKLKLAWIPRAEDLAFWHADNTTSVGGAVNPGVLVWINAPSGAAFDQIYSYQIVCNWELSGHSLASVSAPAIHQPADKNVVEPVISALQFTKSHASGVMEIARTVVGTLPAIAGHLQTASKVGGALLDMFA